MWLDFRPAKAEDFPACCRVLAAFGRGYYDGEVMRALPRLWGGLLAQRALAMTVFEDKDLPPDRRLLGFGTGVFLDDAFCAELLAEPKPYLANRVYQSCLVGCPLPLGYSKIREANSKDGINLVPLDFALTERDLLRPEVFPLLDVVWEAFHFNFYGYRLNWILQEVFGEDWRDFLVAAGLEVCAEFGGLTEPRPYLLGIGRQNYWKRAGSRYTFFFTAPPPRFHFRPSEQALLRLALRNLSDEEAHQELGVTLHTVKRLWKDIFQRVEDLVPGWLPSQGYTGHRGAEKRRHLLDYLAYHLEELRPRLRSIKELR